MLLKHFQFLKPLFSSIFKGYMFYIKYSFYFYLRMEVFIANFFGKSFGIFLYAVLVNFGVFINTNLVVRGVCLLLMCSILGSCINVFIILHFSVPRKIARYIIGIELFDEFFGNISSKTYLYRFIILLCIMLLGIQFYGFVLLTQNAKQRAQVDWDDPDFVQKCTDETRLLQSFIDDISKILHL